MRILQGHCFGCGNVLLWESSSDRSLYCCEGCERGACTCRETGLTLSQIQRREERLRDVYRVA